MDVKSTRRAPRIMFYTNRARLAATCRFKTSLILARADASKVLCGQFRSTAFKDLLSASSKNVAPMRGFPCQAALWLMCSIKWCFGWKTLKRSSNMQCRLYESVISCQKLKTQQPRTCVRTLFATAWPQCARHEHG